MDCRLAEIPLLSSPMDGVVYLSLFKIDLRLTAGLRRDYLASRQV